MQTLVRPLVAEARFYGAAYLVVAAAIAAATQPRTGFAVPTFALAAAWGLVAAGIASRRLVRNRPDVISRDAVRFEEPFARFRRRLALGHLSRRSRATIGGFVGAALALGLVTGVDRVEAAGGMTSSMFVFFAVSNGALAGAYSRLRRDEGGELVSPIDPAGEALVLVCRDGEALAAASGTR